MLSLVVALVLQAPRITKLPSVARSNELVFTGAPVPQANQVLTYHYDGSLNLWDVALGQEVASYKISIPNVGRLRFSADGSLLAVSAYDQSSKASTLYVFDWRTGALKWKSGAGHEPSPWFHAIAWSNAGHRLAVAESNMAEPSLTGKRETVRNVAIYDGDSGTLVKWMQGPELGANALSWQNDDSTLLAGGSAYGDDGITLLQFSVATGQPIWTGRGPRNSSVAALRYRKDFGGWLALTILRGERVDSLRLVVPGDSGKELWRSPPRKYDGSSQAILSAGPWTLVQTEDDRYWALKLPKPAAPESARQLETSMGGLLGELDATRLVTNYLGIGIFDTSTGSTTTLQARAATPTISPSANGAPNATTPRVVISDAPLYHPSALAIDRPRRRLAAVLDQKIVLWDLRSRKRLASWNLGYQRPTALEFAADGKGLRFFSQDGMGLLDVESEAQVGDLAPNAAGYPVALAPKSVLAAVISSSESLRIFDRESGRLVREWKSGIWAPDVLAISPAGDRVAVGAGHGQPMILSQQEKGPRPARTVLVYDSAGKLVRTIRTSGQYIACAAFSPDGKTLAVGSYNYKMPEFKPGVNTGTFEEPVSKAGIEFFLLGSNSEGPQLTFTDVSAGWQGFGALIPQIAWDQTGEFWFVDGRGSIVRSVVESRSLKIVDRFDPTDALATRMVASGESPQALQLLPPSAWNPSDWPGLVCETFKRFAVLDGQFAFAPGGFARWPAATLGSVQKPVLPFSAEGWSVDGSKIALSATISPDALRIYRTTDSALIKQIDLAEMGSVFVNQIALLANGRYVGIVTDRKYADQGSKDVVCLVFDAETGARLIERTLKQSPQIPDPQYAKWQFDSQSAEFALTYRQLKNDSKAPTGTSDTVVRVERWTAKSAERVENPAQDVPTEGARYGLKRRNTDAFSSTTDIVDLASGTRVGTLEPGPKDLAGGISPGVFDKTWRYWVEFRSRPDSGSVSDTVAIWEMPSGKFVGTLSGHHANVTGFAYEPATKRFFTSDDSGLVDVWDSQSRKLLLSLLFPKQNSGWVAITPDGYYAADRSALDAVSFRLGNRAVPFDEFDAVLNRPDKVLEALGYGGSELALAYREAAARRAQRYGAVEGKAIGVNRIGFDGDPPASTAERSIALRALVPTKAPAKLLLWVNNVPIYPSGWTPPLGWKGELPELELGSGTNKIDLASLDEAGGLSVRDTVYVTCTAPSQGVTRVLCIGTSQYKDSSRNLDSPAKDAVDLGRTFKRYKSDGDPEPVVLTNDLCTREGILAQLKIVESASVDDTVIVFLAGHGMLDKEKNYFYGCTDVDFANPAGRGLAFADLEASLSRCKSRKKLVLMDTCCSGLVDPNSVPSNGAKIALKPRAGNAGSDLKETNAFALMTEGFADLKRASGTTIIAAASGVGFALETDKNGYFTQSILEAIAKPSLTGASNLAGITVGGLRRYVLARVPELTGGLQRPVVREENLAQNFKLWAGR